MGHILVTVAMYPEDGLLALLPPSWQTDLLGVEARSPMWTSEPSWVQKSESESVSRVRLFATPWTV